MADTRSYRVDHDTTKSIRPDTRIGHAGNTYQSDFGACSIRRSERIGAHRETGKRTRERRNANGVSNLHGERL